MSLAPVSPDLTAGVPGGAPIVEPPLDARHVAERVGVLLDEIATIADPRLTERTEDLVRLLMQLYGAGIERILELADEAGVLEGDLLDQLVADELVSSLLVVHDLHPLPLATRVSAALDGVRPYLGSHGGDVEIVAIEGDVVRLRMEGSCSSCPSSTVTMTYAIEKAILDAAPEISRVEAEETPAAGTTPLIQLQPRRGRADATTPSVPDRGEWLSLDAEERPGASGLRSVQVAGLAVLLCRAGNDLYAYRDRCPDCGSGLADGSLAEVVLGCGSCGHRFDVRLAGRSMGDDDLHLEPIPLLSDGGTIRLAVPVPVVSG
jgi:Fe-S cluster biogenesis protein NfuA/nitrite reductase/ring-hydroxylating ferredoxin subunit